MACSTADKVIIQVWYSEEGECWSWSTKISNPLQGTFTGTGSHHYSAEEAGKAAIASL